MRTALVHLAAVVALGLFWTPAFAVPDANSEITAAIRQTLQARYTNITVLDVRPSPIEGLYEVFTGNSIAYSNATADFLVVGSVVDTRTKQNLTEQSLDARNTVDFASLPVEQAIKVVRGNGRRQIAVFADPDCPYCQKLEHALASMTDVTIYTYLYPLEMLHPEAPAKARAIWCAKDRAEAWSRWMLEDRPAEAEASCGEDPIKNLRALGMKLRVTSTPTLFFANGKRISGLVPVPQIEQVLNEPDARSVSAK